jgi:hypothetical protein
MQACIMRGNENESGPQIYLDRQASGRSEVIVSEGKDCPPRRARLLPVSSSQMSKTDYPRLAKPDYIDSSLYTSQVTACDTTYHRC